MTEAIEDPKDEENKSKFVVTDKRHWAEDAPETEDVGTERLPTFVQKLKQEAEEKDKRLREYIAAYKAKNAENDEFRQRLQRENESRLDQERANLFGYFLPVLDNLKRAADAAENNRDFDSLKQGIEMIITQFIRELKDRGVQILDSAHRPFDPKIDEAFMTEETGDPAQDNQVVEVLEPGYMYREKLIKPARVKVARLKQ